MNTHLIAVWHLEYVDGLNKPQVIVCRTHQEALDNIDHVDLGNITGPHYHRVETEE